MFIDFYLRGGRVSPACTVWYQLALVPTARYHPPLALLLVDLLPSVWGLESNYYGLTLFLPR